MQQIIFNSSAPAIYPEEVELKHIVSQQFAIIESGEIVYFGICNVFRSMQWVVPASNKVIRRCNIIWFKFINTSNDILIIPPQTTLDQLVSLPTLSKALNDTWYLWNNLALPV